MHEDESILELLDLYTELVEKQDEIIYRLGLIVKRQQYNLSLLQNDAKFSDEKLEQDIAIVNEVKEEYEDVKKGLDDYKP